MLRGKSPLSECIFREHQVEQLFVFLREFSKGDHFILVKKYHFLVFLHVYSQQNKSFYLSDIEICQFNK